MKTRTNLKAGTKIGRSLQASTQAIQSTATQQTESIQQGVAQP